MLTLLAQELALSTLSLIAFAQAPPSLEPTSQTAEFPVDAATTESTIQGELSAADRSDLQRLVSAATYFVTADEDGYESSNPRQRWTTRFDGRGFLTAPSSGQWSWGLKLESFGLAGNEEAFSESVCVEPDGSRIRYQWNDILEEWYVNDRRGLEHGYTLAARPEGDSTSSLAFGLSVRGSLSAEVTPSGRSVRFLDQDDAVALTYSGLYVFDATGAEFEAHFEGGGNSLRLLVDDTGAQYPLTIDPIAQRAFLKASNAEANDSFGWSLAISGDTAVIGAAGEDSGSTGVNGDESNNGAQRSGAAYVFVRTSSGWSQQAYLKASNPGISDQFGWAVAISGNTIAVGASSTFPPNQAGEDSAATGVNGNQMDESAPGSGAVYVFARTGTTWNQQAYIKASNTNALDHFGHSLALQGNTLAVGATGEASSATGVNGDQGDNSTTSAGAVYVFERSGTAWSQQAYIKASNTDAYDHFGRKLTMSGDTLVVGTNFESSSATGVNGDQSDNSQALSGAAYVFVRTGTNWAQEAYLKASNAEAGDGFGEVSLSGDTLVVTAASEDSAATGVDGDQSDNGSQWSGAVYIFVRGATGWSQQAYLKASNTGSLDSFGNSASISGERVLVGAWAECSFGVGVDGDQTSNSPCSDVNGAAYLFERSGVTWSQTAYLKTPIAILGSRFGWKVALDDGLALISAYADSSDAIGINGDPANNNAPFSGAAYVFDLDAPSTDASTAATLCAGDGGDQAGCMDCPCMNNAVAGTVGGCLNSVASAARLNAVGSLSVSLPGGSIGDLRFAVVGAPPSVFALLSSGAAAVPDDMANPCFGLSSGELSASSDGLRCGTANSRQHGIRSTGVEGEVGLTTSPWGGEGLPQHGIARHGSGFSTGQTRYFQAIYRDDPTLSCGRGLNSTQAIKLTFTP